MSQKVSLSFKNVKTNTHSKISKKNVITQDEEVIEENSKLFITAIEDKSLKTVNAPEETKPLVIPLTKNIWETKSIENKNLNTSLDFDRKEVPTKKMGNSDTAVTRVGITINNNVKSETKEKTIEEIAAEEIMRELVSENLNGSCMKGENTVIKEIKMQESFTATSFPSKNGTTETNDGPLLLRNQIPGLKDIKDETERFKYDLNLRAEDLDVQSQAYSSIPVAEFGAALLRGMGWEGPKEDDSVVFEVQPRQHLQGLGADLKPPELRDTQKHIKKPGEKSKEAQLSEWRKKAEDKLKKQKIERNDIVYSREHHTRAIVIQAIGVPGLNKVKVQLEKTGEQFIVSKSSLILESVANNEDTIKNVKQKKYK